MNFNRDFTFFTSRLDENGDVVIYAKVKCFYGWYKLEPVEFDELAKTTPDNMEEE